MGYSSLLHIVEAADKLLIRALKGIIGTEAVHAGYVDAGKEQVAQLGFGKVVIAAVEFGFQLINLFEEFLPSS